LIHPQSVTDLVSAFPGDEKSRELVLMLLAHTPEPFSRDQFSPGHITATGLVLHPSRIAILLVFHHRLQRWLLPGGHVEQDDAEIWDTARREVMEETGAILNTAPAVLAGIDVHGIPPGRNEPYHLHHDLIFAFQAASDAIQPTEEARRVAWCGLDEADSYDLPPNIRRSAARAIPR
jgi:8-oxo-dGTP pyrophosphatase MutT (NUDIX family)